MEYERSNYYFFRGVARYLRFAHINPMQYLRKEKRTIHGTRCVFSPAIAEVVEFFDASFSWDEVSAPMAGQPNGPYHGTGYDFILFCLVVWNMTCIFPNSWDDDPI